jgi:hypothetical protein
LKDARACDRKSRLHLPVLGYALPSHWIHGIVRNLEGYRCCATPIYSSVASRFKPVDISEVAQAARSDPEIPNSRSPDSRFDRETGREPPFPDSAGTGNRGPGTGNRGPAGGTTGIS